MKAIGRTLVWGIIFRSRLAEVCSTVYWTKSCIRCVLCVFSSPDANNAADGWIIGKFTEQPIMNHIKVANWRITVLLIHQTIQIVPNCGVIQGCATILLQRATLHQYSHNTMLLDFYPGT